jgi:hypothetical protein
VHPSQLNYQRNSAAGRGTVAPGLQFETVNTHCGIASNPQCADLDVPAKLGRFG